LAAKHPNAASLQRAARAIARVRAQAQARPKPRIFNDVEEIVVVHEVMISHVGVNGERRDDQRGPDSDQCLWTQLLSACPSARSIRAKRASAGLIEESDILELKNDFTGAPSHSMEFSFEVDVTGVADTVAAGEWPREAFGSEGIIDEAAAKPMPDLYHGTVNGSQRTRERHL
jgi:hypothetical protein